MVKLKDTATTKAIHEHPELFGYKPSARMGLNENKIAEYFYNNYVETAKDISHLFTFDLWKELPSNDKMKKAFVWKAKKFCSKFSLPAQASVRLPEKKIRPKPPDADTTYNLGYYKGWNACLAEIKRLNPNICPADKERKVK